MPTLCTGGIGIPIQFVAWQDLDAADYLFLNSEPARVTREYIFTWHPYVVLLTTPGLRDMLVESLEFDGQFFGSLYYIKVILEF